MVGRMYGAGLMEELYLRQMVTGQLDYQQVWKNDLPLALKMFKAGKLKLFPTFGKAESQEEGRRRTAMIHGQS